MKLCDKICIDSRTRLLYIIGLPIKYTKSFNEEEYKINYEISILNFHFRLSKKKKHEKAYVKQKLKVDKNIKMDALKYAKCIYNLFNKIDTVENIVLGTSEARCGFVEDEKFINFGIDSQDLYYSYKIFEKYKNAIPNLKNIIIYYSIYSSGNDLDKSPLNYRTVLYKVFYDIPYKNKIAAINNGFIDFENQIQKLYKYINKMLPTLPTDILAETSSGFITQKELEDWAKREIKLKEKGGMLHWLKALANSAKENGLKIHVVLLPRNPKVKEIYPDTKYLFEDIITYCDRNNLSVINAFDYEFQEEDFIDLLHLSRKGAEKITQLIKSEVNKEDK